MDEKFTASVQPQPRNGKDTRGFLQTGFASFYGKAFDGRRTANGERYDMYAFTAAHRTLPLGSYVRVSVPSNGRSVIVRINDRGPYVHGRVIDLSYASATALNLQPAGTMWVEIASVDPSGGPRVILNSAKNRY
ncbi:septal ring lytic transglycosylase RlpA family protein [Paraburkholderia susongensis]